MRPAQKGFMVATVLVTHFVFLTFLLLHVLGPSKSKHVALPIDARLEYMLSEHARGLLAVSESLIHVYAPPIHQPWYVKVMHEPQAQEPLFKLLGFLVRGVCRNLDPSWSYLLRDWETSPADNVTTSE
jgi:hypothetical protein